MELMNTCSKHFDIGRETIYNWKWRQKYRNLDNLRESRWNRTGCWDVEICNLLSVVSHATPFPFTFMCRFPSTGKFYFILFLFGYTKWNSSWIFKFAIWYAIKLTAGKCSGMCAIERGFDLFELLCHQLNTFMIYSSGNTTPADIKIARILCIPV